MSIALLYGSRLSPGEALAGLIGCFVLACAIFAIFMLAMPWVDRFAGGCGGWYDRYCRWVGGRGREKP